MLRRPAAQDDRLQEHVKLRVDKRILVPRIPGMRGGVSKRVLCETGLERLFDVIRMATVSRPTASDTAKFPSECYTQAA